MLKNVLALTIDVESSDDVRVYNFYIHYNNNKKNTSIILIQNILFPLSLTAMLTSQQKDRSNSLFNTKKKLFLNHFKRGAM